MGTRVGDGAMAGLQKDTGARVAEIGEDDGEEGRFDSGVTRLCGRGEGHTVRIRTRGRGRGFHDRSPSRRGWFHLET